MLDKNPFDIGSATIKNNNILKFNSIVARMKKKMLLSITTLKSKNILGNKNIKKPTKKKLH